MWEALDKDLKWYAKELVTEIFDSTDKEDLACVHFSTVTVANEMDDDVKLNVVICYGFNNWLQND